MLFSGLKYMNMEIKIEERLNIRVSGETSVKYISHLSAIYTCNVLNTTDTEY